MNIRFIEEDPIAYANGYKDALPHALQVAGNAIQGFFSQRDNNLQHLAWLQTHLVHPSFQHLCFRYSSDVYSVLIAIQGFIPDNDAVVMSKQDYDNLIIESRRHNLIPCISPIAVNTNSPVIGGSHLIHAITNNLVVIENHSNGGNVPMSDWEINNFGISFIVNYIEKQGWKIHSYCDLVDVAPQIWFEKDGKMSYVIVRSCVVGKRNSFFEINQNMLVKLSDCYGYFADFQFCSSNPILKDTEGNIVPLSKRDGDDDIWAWRGDPFYVMFSGLQEIEKAISGNDFIKIVNNDNYVI